MKAQRDPYNLLGVGPEASLKDVREAYRHAALKMHPDNAADNPGDAEKRFIQLTIAYKTIHDRIQRRRNVEEHKTLSAQQLALKEVGWYIGMDSPAGQADGSDFGQMKVRRTYARWNETSVLVLLWLASMGLSMVVVAVLAGHFVDPKLRRFLDSHSAIILIAAGLASYVVLLGVIFLLLVLTRTAVFWTVSLVSHGRRLLPAPDRRKRLRGLFFNKRSRRTGKPVAGKSHGKDGNIP
ncbi:MAG: J domain-containing protein [Phycisphaerae bacterium]